MGRREPFTKSDLPFTESDLREQKKKTAKKKRPKIGLTDAELRTLTQQVGVPPNNRAVVMKEWKPGIDLYRVRILRIEKENPLRASETAQRVADSLRAANRAIAVMPPTERAKFEDYSQVMIEARHAAETQALSKAMLALSSPDREAAAAVLEEPPPIDTKPLEWRLAIACWAANELAKHHNHRVSGAATRTRKTRARDELATYLAGTLINHLPPIAGDRNDVRKRAAARKGAAEVLRALGIKFPDQTSNPAKFNRMFRFKEGLS